MPPYQYSMRWRLYSIIIMRIVAVSDIHGDKKSVYKLIDREKDRADRVIFLGDGGRAEDLLETGFKDKVVYVRGNCDIGGFADELYLGEECGIRIFAAHGHLYNVKYEINTIIEKAKAHGAGILLFGHTHQPLEKYQDGLYILNPGSLRRDMRPSSYGYIEITPSGILTGICENN